MNNSLGSENSKSPQEQDLKVLLSLIVPVFNEEDSVGIFIKRIEEIFSSEKNLELETIFVNDGSKDKTLETLLALQKRYCNIRIVDLSRNFGKEAALSAGLQACKGDIVVPIDVDMQEPPEVILEMIVKRREGYEVVLAKRIERSSDTWLKRNSAKLFYKLHNLIAEPAIPENVGDFRLMDKKVVAALNQLLETNRFMKGLFAWIGFRTTTVGFKRKSRHRGKSKFKGIKLLNLAIDGFTNFSIVPLRIWAYLGVFMSIVSLILIILILVQFFVFGINVPGYPSLMVALTLFGGLQFIGIGMLGEYIGRVFIEAKRRPAFVVRHLYESKK